MSILSASAEDFAVGGRTLPPSKLRATILDARIEDHANGKRLYRMYGNLTTPDGATEIPPVNGGAPFRIGNRKLFARSWIEHTNVQAQQIGNREIKHEAVAAGLMRKPEKGETVELDVNDEYAASLVGKTVLVQTKVRKSFKNAMTGAFVLNPSPEALDKGEVVAEEQAEIANWLQP